MSVEQATAPGLNPGAADLPWYRRALRQGAGYMLPNLLFLLIPAWFGWESLAPGRFLLLVVVLVATGVVFMASSLVLHWPYLLRWAWLGLLLALITLMAVVAGVPANVAFFNGYGCAVAAILLPWRSSRLVILGLSLVSLGIALVQGNMMSAIIAGMGGFVGIALAVSLRTLAMEQRVAEADRRTATIAVSAERDRIARDLHDILGHSLTTIAVKADLAGRLTGRDTDAATREIDEVATIARQALADVRATASGLKDVRLAVEVASAKAVLTSAGVQTRSPTALPPLSDEDSELMGYVVREAVTNVLRHADAQNCTIEVDCDTVAVTDDGRGIPATAPRTGLAGLEDRLGSAGWGMELTSSPGNTRIRAFRREDG